MICDLLLSLTGACGTAGARCNCDANDATSRSDMGYVREKNALPIQQVRVGDIVNSATDSATVEIGPLTCEGAGKNF